MEPTYPGERGSGPGGTASTNERDGSGGGETEEEGVFLLSQCNGAESKRGLRLIRKVKIAQLWVPVIIDTGSTVNLMDEKQLEKVNPRPRVWKSEVRVYPYGGESPLPTRGVVVVEMQWDR